MKFVTSANYESYCVLKSSSNSRIQTIYESINFDSIIVSLFKFFFAIFQILNNIKTNYIYYILKFYHNCVYYEINTNIFRDKYN